jgi:hypothetical protein
MPFSFWSRKNHLVFRGHRRKSYSHFVARLSRYTSVESFTEGIEAMPFTGVVHPDEIAMLRRVFDELCAEQRITNERARHEVADQIMTLFRSGIESPEELRHARA